MNESLRDPGTVTLSDVASAAGVSLATASRVVNGSTRKVAEAYREKVLAAATELGYTANVAAQATARGTSSTIALLVADIADPYFGMIAAGVTRGADAEGMIVTIAVTGRDVDREVELVHALRGQRPRGVILASSRSGRGQEKMEHELDALEALGSRVVVFGGDRERRIEIDNFQGARALGERMADLGYTRAIALMASVGIRTSDDRLAGYESGFSSGGGSIERVYRGAFTRESGAAVMREAIEDGITPGTLIFGLSDVVAVGAMTEARDAGLMIGRDFAICGFDDVPLAHDVTPGLTTVHVPIEEIGFDAFRLVLDGERSAVRGLEVVVRASTPEVLA